MPIFGVDTGGTFTDFYLISDTGEITVYKRPSTPDDPARAILEGLAEVHPASNLQPPATPLDLIHGTTVATNAIIERKGARTALITTRGFRDVLVIGRQTRLKLYDLSPQREPPLVPDELRFEAAERLDFRGEVLTPLDPAEVERMLDDVQVAGAESLAVCFLFSFINPAHERVVADAARKRGIPTSASHEVLPEHREYERTSTTVANAYVAPVMTRYLDRLQTGLSEHRVGRLRVMSSNGGSISPRAAGRLAVRTAVSGPAGGVAGAFDLACRAGLDRIITFDMGGTSTDVSLCPGRILERDETLVGELPIRGPTVDVLTVGAGGGSIARMDAGGALRVGPESAGAHPGPACYGTGIEPTVTDAQVALGRIEAEHFLGGRMTLHPELSLKALDRLVADVAQGRGPEPQKKAAAALLQVANANMESALRRVSVERGYDPRDFTLVAFGGAGPLHACDLAAALRIPRVLVPPYPGVLSALGMATAPIIKDVAASVLLRIDHKNVADGFSLSTGEHLADVRDNLESRGRTELESEGFSVDGLQVRIILDMRYAGQSYELPVAVDSLDSAVFVRLFHETHQARYGHSDQSRAIEVVNLRLKLVLPAATVGASFPGTTPLRHAAPAPTTHRDVWFDGAPTLTAVYGRATLMPGASFDGPGIITQMDSTSVVPPGWRAAVDGWSNLVLEPA